MEFWLLKLFWTQLVSKPDLIWGTTMRMKFMFMSIRARVRVSSLYIRVYKSRSLLMTLYCKKSTYYSILYPWIKWNAPKKSNRWRLWFRHRKRFESVRSSQWRNCSRFWSAIMVRHFQFTIYRISYTDSGPTNGQNKRMAKFEVNGQIKFSKTAYGHGHSPNRQNSNRRMASQNFILAYPNAY